jgi:paraquat-inducible protein B
VGAPVEFRGFPIGQVVDMDMEFDWNNKQVLIPVKIEIEPERIRQLSVSDDAPDNALEVLVDQGLRAQIRTGSLITGKLYVAIDFFRSAKPAKLVMRDNIVEIPTIPTPMEALSANLAALMEKLQKLPVEEIGDSAVEALRGVSSLANSAELKSAVRNLDQSLVQVKKLTASLNQDVPRAVHTVSKQAAETMAEIESLVGADSAVAYELKRALKEFAEAAQALRVLADRLERHPESLLQGKGSEK